jgi:hypothetical protein
MKLLLDENLSRRLVPSPQDRYPGSTQVALVGLERADDRTIWKYAKDNDFVIVTRSSGRTTILLNGSAQNENTRSSGVHISASPKDPERAVVIPDDDAPASLKVGESIDRATGKKEDVVRNGLIEVNHALRATPEG